MNLENMTKIYARGDSRIQLKVIPGHFVTSQSISLTIWILQL